MEHIDKSLDGLRTQGVLDSSGEFELHESRMHELEARNLLQEPSDAVTLLLQAFVHAPTNFLEVYIGVTGVKFVFWCAGDHPYEVEYLQSCLQGEKTPHSLVEHLVKTLRAAQKHFFRIKMKVGKGCSLTISGGQVSTKGTHQRADVERIELTLNRKNLFKGLKNKVFRILGHHSVYRRGFAYPKGLMIDTLPELRFPCHPSHTFRTRADGWQMSNAVVDKDDHFELSDLKDSWYDAPTLYRHKESGVTEHSEKLAVHGYIAQTRYKENLLTGNLKVNRWLQCGLAFAIPMHLQGPGRLYLIDRGMSLEPVELDLGCPGIVCVASADGFNTDLSGLRVVENSTFQRKVARLRKRAEKFVEKTREIKHELKGVALGQGLMSRNGPALIKFVRPHLDQYRNTLAARFPQAIEER